jgi:hypothetical protein
MLRQHLFDTCSAKFEAAVARLPQQSKAKQSKAKQSKAKQSKASPSHVPVAQRVLPAAVPLLLQTLLSTCQVPLDIQWMLTQRVKWMLTLRCCEIQFLQKFCELNSKVK